MSVSLNVRLGKVQVTGQLSWGDKQTVPANAGQEKFIVKMAHHKKSVHKAQKSPSLKRGLKYINKHWKHYNKKWPKYGNDCTNFASQYMRERGYKQTSAGIRVGVVTGQWHNVDKWYCKKPHHKKSYLWAMYPRLGILLTTFGFI